MSRKILLIAGLGGSGEEHWQTHIANTYEDSAFIELSNIDSPDCMQWEMEIEEAILEANEEHEEIIVIAHSMGCLAFAALEDFVQQMVDMVYLVAPADLENAPEQVESEGFDVIEPKPMQCAGIVIASTNDSWCSIEQAKEFALDWDVEYLEVEGAGHFTSTSGYGKRIPEGIELD